MDKNKIHKQIVKLAHAAVAAHGLIEEQIQAFLDALTKNKQAEQLFRAEAAENAARNLIHDTRHTVKRWVKTPPPENIQKHDARDVAALHSRSMMDWLLPDGRRLGDVRGDELAPLADEEQRIARGHAKNAKFYRLVAAKAGHRLVRRAFKEDALRELWDGVKPKVSAA